MSSAKPFMAYHSSSNLNDSPKPSMPGKLGDVTLGVNWYPYAHVRLMANYVHAHLLGVGRANIFQMRLGADF